jgi:hypothetical protein
VASERRKRWGQKNIQDIMTEIFLISKEGKENYQSESSINCNQHFLEKKKKKTASRHFAMQCKEKVLKKPERRGERHTTYYYIQRNNIKNYLWLLTRNNASQKTML